ncbi:MAG: hotdog domain-containing protein [Roseovarius sp.]
METGCKYHAQLRFPQTVEAGMRISHIGRSSVRP